LEGVSYAFWFEAEGAGTGFVGDAAVAINYVEAVGPAGVVAFSRVLEIVEHGRKFDAELDDAELAHLGALVLIFGRGENYVVVDIVRILPDVGGVRFANVNRIELDLIFIFRVQVVEGGNLPPEWRSSVAAKNEDDRLLAAERGKSDGRLVIDSLERKIGSHVADIVRAGARDFPERFKREHDERGPGDVTHHAREAVWTRQHQAEESGGEHRVQHDENDEDLENFLHHALFLAVPVVCDELAARAMSFIGNGGNA
jgi:hypothetical protein